MTRKKVLVTGGAGFLGSHLCTRLIDDGFDVVCVDNFSSGSKDNIQHLCGKGNFEIIAHDIVNPLFLEVDQIFNLACPASPSFYKKDPIQTTKTCVYGSINMLDLAQRVNAKILQASTSEVYGDPEIHPQSESYCGRVNAIGPRACYDEGKRCAETLFFDYWRQRKLDVKVVRIFNAFGPKMLPNDGRVVSNFIVHALLGDPISIYGDGSQTRSFCYVNDIINGMICMMNGPSTSPGPVNIGNPNEIAILALAELILELTSSQSKLVYHSRPIDDPSRRRPDISLARQLLSWKPKFSLREGLAETISYYQLLLKQ